MSDNRRCIYTVSSKVRIQDAFLFAFQIGRVLNSNKIDFFIFVSQEIEENFEVEIPEYFKKSIANVKINIVQPSSFSPNFFLRSHFSRTDIEKVVAFKAYALAYLFELNTYDNVTYFDSDVFLVKLIDSNIAIGENLIYIAPHTTNYFNPELNIYLRDGAFNSGYFILNFRHKNTLDFINFFCNFCRSYCYHNRNLGLFVDQKAFDIAHMFFDISVIRNSETNRAYWNLNEKAKTTLNFDSFFHFSGLNCNYYHKLSIHSQKSLSLDIVTLNSLTEYSFLKKSVNSSLFKQIKIPCCNLILNHKINFNFIDFNSFSEDYYVTNQFNVSPKIFSKFLSKVGSINFFQKIFKLMSDQRFLKNN